ncbi:unnamed protein product [Peronospora effusa]|nr:unnamed protein product [Peronospora effusa]
MPTPAATLKSQCMRHNKSVTSQDEAAHSTDVVSPVSELDPKNYREAIKITQCLNWKKAMEEELAALESNDV